MQYIVEQLEADGHHEKAEIVRQLIAGTSRLLTALDDLQQGCKVRGFRSLENGFGENAGDMLQDAYESLTNLTEHVPVDNVTYAAGVNA
jgi:hypothetical protein